MLDLLAKNCHSKSRSPSLFPWQIDPDVDLDELARLSDGYSGADIANVCRDASMVCDCFVVYRYCHCTLRQHVLTVVLNIDFIANDHGPCETTRFVW